MVRMNSQASCLSDPTCSPYSMTAAGMIACDCKSGITIMIESRKAYNVCVYV